MGNTKYEGFATMFMRMPMSTSTLPVQGTCTVEDRRITLKFPFTGIEFELPGSPNEYRSDFDFKIRGVRGDMTMTIGYIAELKAYTGVGKQEDDDMPVLTFCFYPTDSPLTRLPRLFTLRTPGLCILMRRSRISWKFLFFVFIAVACISIIVFTIHESKSIARQQADADRHRLAGKFFPVNDPTNMNDLSLNYGIVVDCGSSGSRVFVYYWPPHTGEEAHLLNIRLMRDVHAKPVVKKIEPGLATHANNPSTASDHVGELLRFAAAHIPSVKHKETSAYIMATAGMRMLNQKDQDAILNDLRIDLHLQFEFLFSPKHVEVITGKQEGIYSWISVNYALGKFDHNINDADKLIAVEVPGVDKLHIRKRTVGMLDLGGASFQMAFEVPKSVKFEPKDDGLLAEFNLGCSNSDLDHVYRVYVATFLGMGSNSIRTEYESILVADYQQSLLANLTRNAAPTNTSTHVINDPCLPVDKLEQVQIAPRLSGVTFRGTGNLDACVNYIRPQLNKTQPCSYKSQCSLHGLYMPEIDFDNSEFFGFSEFYYTMEDILRIGGKYDSSQFRLTAQKHCATNWSLIESWQASGLFPRADSNRYRLQCFKSAWMLAVLHDGVEFPRDYNQFTSAQYIEGSEVHWSLGALLFKTKFFPLRDIEKHRSDIIHQSVESSTTDPPLPVLTITVILVVGFGCLYLLVRHRLMNRAWGMRRVQTMAYYMTDSGEEQDGIRLDRTRNFGNYPYSTVISKS